MFILVQYHNYDQCNKLKFKIIIINVVFHLNVSCLF